MHVCDMHFYACHAVSIRVTAMCMYVHDMPCAHVGHCVFNMFVPPIRTREMSFIRSACRMSMCDACVCSMRCLDVWHCAFTCVTFYIYTWQPFQLWHATYTDSNASHGAALHTRARVHTYTHTHTHTHTHTQTHTHTNTHTLARAHTHSHCRCVSGSRNLWWWKNVVSGCPKPQPHVSCKRIVSRTAVFCFDECLVKNKFDFFTTTWECQ